MRSPLNVVLTSTASATAALALLLTGCAGDGYVPDGDDFTNPPTAEEGDFEGPGSLPPQISVDPEPDYEPVPSPFAEDQFNPQSIRLAGDHLYWIDDSPAGSFLRTVHVDGGPVTTIDDLQSAPFDAAINSTGLFLSRTDSLEILYLAHGSGEVVTLHDANAEPLAIALDDNYVFWTTADGCVERGPLEGGDVDVVACADGSPIDLVVDDGQLYWATVEGMLYTTSTEPTGIWEKVASGETFSTGLALDGDYVFWANELSRDVRRLRRSTSQLDVIATAQFAPAGITQDRFYVYVTTTTEGAVKAIPKAGGDAIVIAAGQSQPADITSDDDFLYWVNEGDGKVMRGQK